MPVSWLPPPVRIKLFPAAYSMRAAFILSASSSMISSMRGWITALSRLTRGLGTFEDKKLSAQLAKIYKDINRMVSDF